MFDLAHFIVWSGVYAHVAPVHPRVIHALRRRLFGALAEHFSRQQIEELTWRTTQCVAFNWHNAGPRAGDQACAGAVTAGRSTSDRGIVTRTSRPMTTSVVGTPTLSLITP